MKLTELSAYFLVRSTEGDSWKRTDVGPQDTDGVIFLCPLCFTNNNGPVGTHSVICWFAGRVPDDVTPGPGRWTPEGTSLDDLTFVPGSPPKSVSVLLTGGCGWHGFVKNGEAA